MACFTLLICHTVNLSPDQPLNMLMNGGICIYINDKRKIGMEYVFGRLKNPKNSCGAVL